MPRDDTRVWQELRALRAAPVGQAAEDEDRRAVFAAALRQSQELADAAAVAGYATKPLALFYCLSQGVRALAAALVDDDGWRIVGHGASVTSAEPLMASRVSPKPTIRCDRRDAFSMLQAVHGLPAITE